MKLFLDTNTVLRYLVDDNKSMSDACTSLFQKIEQGAIRPYISTIVLLEIYWVITSHYQIVKAKAQLYIDMILQARGLVIVEKTNFRKAFTLHRQTGIKLADCLIATQVGKGISLCTYDTEFKKLPGFRVVTPEEVVGNI
ncbi:PIN domain-containing protein [Candidatus Gottesmanbacteria bacterium]|nr:PIN domain-containing protein [Candidatus Gottesmanbacteria bacterium]